MTLVPGWRELLKDDPFSIISDSYRGEYVFVSWVKRGEEAVVRDSSGETHTIHLYTDHPDQIILSRIPARTIAFQAVRGVIRLDDLVGPSDSERVERALAKIGH